jgi:2-succinyl-5-enolpyruvyl-6-hydroxy-3-cyclohexene-1-carboxylate synthase
VHLEVPLRKPLEPAAPSTEEERALARIVAELRRAPIISRAPRLVADHGSLDALAAAIAAEPRGMIVAGALPLQFGAARDAVYALAARAGYPILAESGSQLRSVGSAAHATRSSGCDLSLSIDHFDLVLGSPSLAGAQAPRLIIQLGSEPVAAAWNSARSGQLADATCWVLADHAWRDPDSSARAVIIGDLAESIEYLVEHVAPRPSDFAETWQAAELRAVKAIDRALAAHPRSEGVVIRAAIEAASPTTIVQIGNSLPIRVVDLVAQPRRVVTQRGAAGIDGLIASAAGATRAGSPVLLILGDVSFAHDLGGLLAAREASAPLAIVVVDNDGGRIFNALPIAKSGNTAAFERHFVTAPHVDPAAVATALGARAVTAASASAVAAAVATALETRAVTVIHAPVSATGAQDVRRSALELLDVAGSPRIRTAVGESHV